MKFDLRPPGGNITWLSLIWLVLGCLFVAAFVQGLPATWPWFCASTFVIAVSAGLWFRRPWARWAGFVVAAALLGLRISGLFRHGITLSQSLRLFFNLWYFWALWEWDLRKDESTDSDNDDAPMISLVQLLREPR
ncbi:MAG TPA: hypothetical protein VFI31_21480, partial [Pirellulales bacterium]|nr:hypothetical protein [Pirellulales bacterium]